MSIDSNTAGIKKFFQPARNPPSPSPRSKQHRIEIDLNNLECDPGLRSKLSSFYPNDQDKVRRYYWEKGPCQPKLSKYPTTLFGKKLRAFNSSWFVNCESWLEYSIEKDSVFCLCCYLFKQDFGDQSGGDCFVGSGYKNWKQKDGIICHVGRNHQSAHNRALARCLNLLNEDQQIQNVFVKQSSQARIEYRIRLEASLDTIRIILKQGLAFRGHDESENSDNRGNFLELLQWLADHNGDIKSVALKNAPENHKLTSSDIQKDIIYSCAHETIKSIISEIGDEFYSVLIDEARDHSVKEQMAVVLRYVNEKGNVIECFIGIEHVARTSALSLKAGLDSLFSKYGLSISRLRGQGYDGASNMQGELKGLKTLILNENECAYFVHCFAHQLQLALVAVAKSHPDVTWFFNSVTTIVNVCEVSCKRRDDLREKKAKEICEALRLGEIVSGTGLNQETSLIRSCETRWGSNYGTLSSMIYMYSAVLEVLEGIRDDEYDQKHVGEARGLLFLMEQFDFIFNMHLMKSVLSVTNELSKALQRKDQDIVNAVNLVELSQKRLQTMRDNGWENLLEGIRSFCIKHKLDIIPDMNANYLVAGRKRRGGQEITNLHYYRANLFYTVLDMQLQELNHRFNEVSTELLTCMVSLSPDGMFSSFDKDKLIRLACLYPNDFSELERAIYLGDQLDTYIFDVRNNDEFRRLKGLGNLARKMVETKRDKVYPLVYRLLKLTLVLPVATATVERVFSAMKIVKTRLRNRMGNDFLNDSLLVYIERVLIKKHGNKRSKKTAPLASGAWPIIGHLHLLGGHPDLPHKVLSVMADKFGPIFSIKLGFSEAIVVSNVEIAKECFTSNDAVLADRPRSIGIEVMCYNYAVFGFGPYGSYWRRMRKIIMNELLSNQRLELLSHIRISEVKTCIKDIYNLWLKSKGDNVSGADHKVLVDMKSWFGDLSVNIIVRIVSGNRCSDKEDVDRFKIVSRDFFTLIGTPLVGDAFPLLRWFDYGGHEKKMKATAKELDDILQKWLDEHKQKRISTEGAMVEQDFMDVLLSILESETDTGEPGEEEKTTRFDADTINKATCLSAVTSGTDSIIVTLTWVLSLLLNNPHVLKKVQEELEIHVGRKKQVEESDIKNLVYLHAVIKEAMRFNPTGPFLLRVSVKDSTVGGYHVPKGTRLFLNIEKIQRDPSVWENPDEFMPERFMSTHKRVEARGQDFTMIPFGCGRRMCPGVSYSLQLMYLTMANLLHSFEVEKSSDESIDMSEGKGLSNLKATPLEVFVTPRLSAGLFE